MYDFSSPEWHTVEGVPILDEHEVVGKDGQVVDRIDLKRLHRIAVVNNRKTADGNPAPIILGHTSDHPDAAEKPVHGYLVKYRVGKYKDRHAIYVDYKMFPEHAGVTKQYPRRSVEWWTDTDEIDPLALLGGTTPERHLGVVRKSRDGDKYRYSITEFEDDPMPAPQRPGYRPQANGTGRRRYAADGEEDMGAIDPGHGTDGPQEDPAVAALMESKGYKDLCAKVDKLTSLIEGAMGGGEPGGEDGMTPDDGMGMEGEDQGHPPVHMEASGMGSGSDTYIQPGTMGRKYGASQELPDEDAEGYAPMHHKMSRGTAQRVDPEVARLREENASTKRLLAKVVRKLSRAEAEKQVAALQAEGIEIPEPATEVEMMAALDDEGRAFECERIRRCYKRKATDITTRPTLHRYARNPEPDEATAAADEPMTPLEASQLAEYMVKSKVTDRGEALKKFRRQGQPTRR